jgi:hypothetical protein
MYGFNNIPDKTGNNTFIYNCNSGSFQTWNKPAGVSMVHFVVIGGGGGGGSGYYSSSITTLAKSGGSGGAPGGLVCGSIPAILLPNTLYLQVGAGGAGGTAVNSPNPSVGNSGSSGGISYVCLYPEINSGSILLQSSQTVAGGGVGGQLASTTGLSTNPTIANSNDLKWIALTGNTVSQTAGGAGVSNNNAPASIAYAGLLTGGAGGAGHSINGNNGGVGGNITFSSLSAWKTLTVASGIAGTAAGVVPGNGNVGYSILNPLIFCGGSGGGGAAAANRVGGEGGGGGIGCGGGGGGFGTLISGAGGSGGEGIIIITCS